MPVKRVLITGTTGLLGKTVVEVFSDKARFEIFGISRKRKQVTGDYHHIAADLTDTGLLQCLIKDIKPAIIVHCAANVNVDDCERNKEYVYDLHVNSTKTIASYNPRRTTLVYISTDSVYDGNKSNHTEFEKISPSNHYAFTKLEGEICAQKRNSNSIIIRTNIYGFQRQIGVSLAEWAIQHLSQHSPIYGFSDVFFNPVYTKQLSRLIHSLIAMNFRGIVNIGSNLFISKYDFLVRLCEHFNFSADLVRKKSIDDDRFAARRPKNTTMDVSLLKSIIGQVPDLTSGLKEMKKDWDSK